MGNLAFTTDPRRPWLEDDGAPPEGAGPPTGGGPRGAPRQGYWPATNRSPRSVALDTFESVGRPRIASIDLSIELCV